jgi:hypothetical protein
MVPVTTRGHCPPEADSDHEWHSPNEEWLVLVRAINDALMKQKKGFGTCCAGNPFSV